MKKLILATAAAAALTLPFGGFAFAASEKHLEPGVPGEPNCKGQTIAFLAQLAANPDAMLDINPGIGNLAEALGVSVQELQALVDEFCAGEPMP